MKKLLIICAVTLSLALTACKGNTETVNSEVNEPVISETFSENEPAETIVSVEEPEPMPEAQEASDEETLDNSEANAPELMNVTFMFVNMTGTTVNSMGLGNPFTGEPILLEATEDGDLVSVNIDWPTEVTKAEFAVFDFNNEVVAGSVIDLTGLKTGATIVVKGDGNTVTQITADIY